MTEHGRVHWNELMTRDTERAKAFYGSTLGWKYEGMQMPDGMYWVASKGEGPPVGGLLEMDGPQFEGTPEHWFTYFAVSDIDKTLKDVAAAGGTVVRPVFEVPNVGRIAIVQDPGGAMSGYMTPAPMG